MTRRSMDGALHTSVAKPIGLLQFRLGFREGYIVRCGGVTKTPGWTLADRAWERYR